MKRTISDEKLFDLAELYKNFADSTRIRILHCLLGGEKNVSEISISLNMNQSAISHQLRILKNSKLIKNRKDGKTVYYSLCDNHVFNIIEQGLEHIND